MSVLWVVGDSTLCAFNEKCYYPRCGYGVKLENYLNANVTVNNLALSGRSSLSFTKEDNYKKLLSGMTRGDFLIVGFGHNDEKAEADRFTSPVGGIGDKGTFASSLYENYIQPALQRGCTPILCTPIVRRRDDGDWKPVKLHCTSDRPGFPGGDYPQVVRDLAAKLGLVCVDMTFKTKSLYDKLGTGETQYLHAWPSDKAVSVDNTHTNVWGATVNAFLVMSELADAGIHGLSENIVNIDENSPLPAKEKYLCVNPEYKSVVFDDNLAQSKYFEDAYGFKGTVFGDIMRAPSECDDFVLERTDEGIHMSVKGNNGRISSVTDGIAMYYKVIPIDTDFTFKAKARINRIFSNDQVSFGLMVRDDMYIDMKTQDILGDYVAAAPLWLTTGDAAWSCYARKNGALMQGGVIGHKLSEGDVVDMMIASNPDGYAVSFADGPVLTGGFDFKLSAIDPKHVYAGLFVSRNVDVTFTDIVIEQ